LVAQPGGFVETTVYGTVVITSGKYFVGSNQAAQLDSLLFSMISANPQPSEFVCHREE
jgi:hypothetical protein